MDTPLAIVRGEERTFGVAIVEDGAPIDLTGFTISAEIGWRGKVRFKLVEGIVYQAIAWVAAVQTYVIFDDDTGSGLSIINLAPSPPGAGEDPSPQYSFKITEGLSDTFPIGVIAHIRQIVVDADGVTTIRGPRYFDVSDA